MMKHLMILLVAFLPLCTWAQAQKIAVVDVMSIYNACPEKDSAEHVLADLSAQFHKEYKVPMSLWKDYESNRQSLLVFLPLQLLLLPKYLIS